MTMNNTSKKPCSFQIGTSIRGKWHHKEYVIQKELGAGANGVVYLAGSTEGTVAIKFSDNPATIATEVNVLKSLEKVQDKILGPSLLDVDDIKINGNLLPFYVMEYIQGDHLLDFLERKGSDWIVVMALQVLSNLEELHKLGWIFGDLKPENLIVQSPQQRIRFIDVGGTTQAGRAIKEYTEYFDRGYWSAGGRRAEPSYDLFALTMIIINATYQKRFVKSGDGLQQLYTLIEKNQVLKKLEPVLKKALEGKYQTAEQMKREMIDLSFAMKKQTPQHSVKKSTYTAPSQPYNSQVRRTRSSTKRKNPSGWMETFFLIAVVTLLYVFYIVGQVV